MFFSIIICKGDTLFYSVAKKETGQRILLTGWVPSAQIFESIYFTNSSADILVLKLHYSKATHFWSLNVRTALFVLLKKSCF